MKTANQASEDELRKQINRCFVPHEDHSWPCVGCKTTRDNLYSLIRTEKLKLLAEVRDQTTIFKIKAHDKKGQPHLYEAGRGVPTEVLAKLEAEL